MLVPAYPDRAHLTRRLQLKKAQREWCAPRRTLASPPDPGPDPHPILVMPPLLRSSHRPVTIARNTGDVELVTPRTQIFCAQYFSRIFHSTPGGRGTLQLVDSGAQYALPWPA